MACGDVVSLESLQTQYKHQLFEIEVITGKVGGTGASIGTATNQVTGQTQQTLPSILADLGFDVQSWTSSTGGVLASANQVFLDDTPGSLGLGDYYAWGGTFPKTVPAGTDPALPTSGYIMRSSRFAGTQAREALRRSYADAGYNLVKGSFEAGGTLVNANDVLLQERTGKAFSGPAGTVAAGTNPATGGFVDRSMSMLSIFGNMLMFYNTPSYTALVSDSSKWTDDVGTRLYLCPQEKVTSGTGGALKIFGDPYHKGGLSDYRDFGAYFSANQGGYAGYHGTGTFYLNSKVSGISTGEYFTKNPDIALTFQDGQTQAWRSTYLPSDANGPTRAVTVFGKLASTTAVNRGDISIELANKMGIDRFGGFAFWGEGNFSTVFEHRVGADNTDLLRFNYYNVPKLTFKWSGVDQGIIADTRIVGRQATISTGGGNISAAGFNSAVFSNSAARTISDFTDGLPGQEITLIFETANTTVTHGSAIALKGGTNFVATAGSVLTLVRSASKWYEKCRQ